MRALRVTLCGKVNQPTAITSETERLTFVVSLVSFFSAPNKSGSVVLDYSSKSFGHVFAFRITSGCHNGMSLARTVGVSKEFLITELGVTSVSS